MCKGVATRTNALWQSSRSYRRHKHHTSQPARMRCGKDCLRFSFRRKGSRNPHECAVAKSGARLILPLRFQSQPARMRCGKVFDGREMPAQEASQPARMRCGKDPTVLPFLQANLSQPARMRCGKGRLHGRRGVLCGRNPHECAVAKQMPSSMRRRSVATRTNALWQRGKR